MPASRLRGQCLHFRSCISEIARLSTSSIEKLLCFDVSTCFVSHNVQGHGCDNIIRAFSPLLRHDTQRDVRKSEAAPFVPQFQLRFCFSLIQRICTWSPTRFAQHCSDTFSGVRTAKYQRDNTRVITELLRSGRVQIYRTLFADIVCKLLHHVSRAVIYTVLRRCISLHRSENVVHVVRTRVTLRGQSETSAHASSELLRDEMSSRAAEGARACALCRSGKETKVWFLTVRLQTKLR